MQRGWTTPELIRTLHILERKNQDDIHSHKIVYWSTLLTTIIGNIFLSLTLIPLLLFLTTPIIYFITLLLALLTGTIYTHLIDQINHLTDTHHLSAMIFIPVISIITIIGIVTLSNHLGTVWNLAQNHNPIPIAILFAISFLLPTIVQKVYHNQKV